VVIIGADGQLGKELGKLVPNIPLTHKDIEVAKKIKPINKLVINCAAFHDVSGCEEDPEKAFRVNAWGAYNVARAAKEVVFISTDYVFDGRKKSPYLEKDLVNPINIYGASKAAGENLVRMANKNHFIIRTSALYGGVSKKGWTFPELMLKKARNQEEIKVADDLYTATTYVSDLARAIIKLIKTKKFGTYHITNKGGVSWYDFAREIFRIKNLDYPIEPIKYNGDIVRPKNSVLGSAKIVLRPWKKALAEYLELT